MFALIRRSSWRPWALTLVVLAPLAVVATTLAAVPDWSGGIPTYPYSPTFKEFNFEERNKEIAHPNPLNK